ncbi:hypothetical protein [Robiginitomaculum antarcticum]|uniref:hypothetical protein n=1 Tax=Robiginitomaculum antarcticum TaxID=437507 RepID=UPI000368396A|nr:hypothetical protein [Robiginitomaculum antarcticum]
MNFLSASVVLTLTLSFSELAIAQTNWDAIFEEASLSHLSPDDQAKVIKMLGLAYAAGRQDSAPTSANYKSNSTCPTSTRKLVETRIDGEFEGWDGETIFKMSNGQIWQQSEYNYHYRYAYRPEVFLFKDNGRWKMKVDGVDKALGVECLQ